MYEVAYLITNFILSWNFTCLLLFTRENVVGEMLAFTRDIESLSLWFFGNTYIMKKLKCSVFSNNYDLTDHEKFAIKFLKPSHGTC